MSNIDLNQMPLVFNILNKAAERIYRLTGVPVSCYTEPTAVTKKDYQKEVLKKLVCRHFKVGWKQVVSKSRKQKGDQLVDARYTYMYFAQKELHLGCAEAAADCNRNHSIALLATKHITNYYATNDEVIAIIDKIKNDLKNDITIN